MKNEYVQMTVGAIIAVIIILLLSANVPETDLFVDDYGTDYGIVGSWDFEEGQGTITYDQSPYGNDGEVTGATWTSGKYGSALTFDGNDYVTIPDSASLNLSSEITIEAWAKDPPLPFGPELGGNFTIVGDAVVVNDTRAYLSAQPHTIGSSGWVEFTLISKKYSGDIDVVWGFNRTESRPSNPQIWANYSHTLWRWVEVEKTYLNETTGETFNYTDYEKMYYESAFPDWKNLDKDFVKKSIKAKGMDTWYILKSVPIEKGREYKVRCWVEIPFAGSNIVRGKYAWGIKRSTDTIHEAIDKDAFYFIDPWYDSSWFYRTKITVDHTKVDAVLTNFTVMVKLNSSRIDWSHVQDDLDDLRFTSADGVSLLSYEVENHTVNTEAWLWVRLPTVSNTSDTTFYMYYGNPTASSGEDIVGTWDPSAVLVQHLQESTNSTCIDSTIHGNDGNPANGPIQTPGYVDGSLSFDGSDDHVIVPYSPSLNLSGLTTLSIPMWIKTNETDYALVFRQTKNGIYYSITTSKVKFSIRHSTLGDSSVRGNTDVNDDVWHYVVGVFDGSYLRVYVDGVEDATPVARTDPIGEPGSIRHLIISAVTYWYPTYYSKGIIDEVRIYSRALSPEEITTSYESERDNLLTFGSEYPAYKVIVEKFGAYLLGIDDSTLIGQINFTDVRYEIDSVTSWHYYSMTYNGSNICLYIDGVLVNTTACTGSIDTNNRDVLIGTRFLGEIDQVRIYNVAKTVGEIRNHYLNSRGMYSRSVTVSDDFKILNSTLHERLTVNASGVDLHGNPLLETDIFYMTHFSMESGATNMSIGVIPAGMLVQDMRFVRIGFAVDQAPGVGKEANVTISDGTTTISVELTDDETHDISIPGSFILDASSETLTMTYSQSAGGACEKGHVIILYQWVVTP